VTSKENRASAKIRLSIALLLPCVVLLSCEKIITAIDAINNDEVRIRVKNKSMRWVQAIKVHGKGKYRNSTDSFDSLKPGEITDYEELGSFNQYEDELYITVNWSYKTYTPRPPLLVDEKFIESEDTELHVGSNYTIHIYGDSGDSSAIEKSFTLKQNTDTD
jgi:hypothetical protein